MKTLILAMTLVTAVFVNALAAQAAGHHKPQPFDGAKFFEDINSRG